MRTRKSCDACHSRKIKCDLALPQCDWCFHRKIPCTFNQVPRQASTTTNRAASEVGTHTQPSPKSAEQADASPIRDNPPSSSHFTTLLNQQRPPNLPSGVHFGKLHFAGRDLGNISSSNGLPFFSDTGREWIRSCAGEEPAFPDLPGELLLVGDDAREQAAGGKMELEMPGREVVEDYLRFFRSSHLRLEFPVVDSGVFEGTIRVAYGVGIGEGVERCEMMLARACVFAFVALMSLFEGERRSLALRVDGDACALKARRLLSASPQDLGVTTLQTALMLSIHLLFSGQIPLSSVYHSLACRVMFMLGGHLLADPWTFPSEFPNSDCPCWTAQGKRHLRKLFWLCYIWDKEISLRTGQPPAIADEHCDLTLPGGYLSIQYKDEDPYKDVTALNESAVPLLPGDLQLNIIKSKASTVLYSARALRKTDADLLRDIRELDEELESWRLSVPPLHRPVLSLRESSVRFREGTPKSVRTIVMNFEYHYLVATIHQATSRCRAWTARDRDSGEIDSVRSSLNLAVEASRSTLLSLRYVVHGLLEEATWTIVFYPMSAVVTIFCNILWDPLQPSAEEDLKLLQDSPELIRCIRRRRMTDNEMKHLRIVDDFLAELARLARCAIDRAREREEARLRYWR